jgi:hypothetical protein
MDWTKVLTHPIGLVAYALALVFALLSRKHKGLPPWWPTAAIAVAVMCIFGGLALAYSDQTKNPEPTTRQTATANGGTAINVQGTGNTIGATPPETPVNCSEVKAPTTAQQANSADKGVAVNVGGCNNRVNTP